ncbi:MAG: DNA primase [Bacteroidaceae bacterium]|nr:DNA primase [Bacteroidaceae bacterium]
MIDQITIGKIMDAANIVDVVSDFVTLKRSGANLKGLCPFHDDRTPSFTVSPAKNLCKCFACGKGGSPVGFIMEHEQMSYPEALRYLARKYGIPIEEKELTEDERQVKDDRESMFIVNEWARGWFCQQLNDTDDGRAIGLAYFRGRGFRDDILQKFQVGFAPDNRNISLTAEAIKAGYQEKYLTNTVNEREPRLSVGTGLSLKRSDGKLGDRFRGRVMWPIFTMGGRVAGFGGRVLDAATKGVNVKYMNSPESIVYSKRQELFGLYHAKEAIRKKDFCYMVEGYTDVMGMHQAGVENVVASSGTALTQGQIRLIHRLTNNIVAIFDGDEAGIHASERGIDMFLAEGMNVKLLLLPDNEDPDSFARKLSAEEFQKYLNEHQVDFIQYKISHLMQEAQNDVNKMAGLVHNVAATIAVIPDEITRVLYIKEAAKLLSLKEELITSAVTEERRRLNDERIKEEARRTAASQIKTEDTATPRSEPSNTPSVTAENPDTTEAATSPATSPANQATPAHQASNRRLEQEKILVEMIIRYGEQVVFCTEDENGNCVPLTVIEFIMLSMREEGLTFSDPRHLQIMDDALAQVKQEGFNAMHYFVNHPQLAVSQLAATLCMDQIPLSKYHGNETGLGNLDETIPRLIYNIKLEMAKDELLRLTTQLSHLPKDCSQEEKNALLNNYLEAKKLVQELAFKCDQRVFS